MIRGGVIVALVAVLWWLFMDLPAGALRKHPVAIRVSGPSAQIFSLPGKERLIVYPGQLEKETAWSKLQLTWKIWPPVVSRRGRALIR